MYIYIYIMYVIFTCNNVPITQNKYNEIINSFYVYIKIEKTNLIIA